MSSIAVIVTGDRHAQHLGVMDAWTEVVTNRLKELEEGDVRVLIHGDGRGIDQIADYAGRIRLWTVVPMPAQWSEHDKAAGPLRNKAMLRALQALEATGYLIRVVAFHNNLAMSKGTAHMVRIAQEAGIETEIHDIAGTATTW